MLRADAVATLRKLDEDYQKKQAEAAKKQAQEQAEVAKKTADLQADLLTDESEKRIRQLTAVADKEVAQARSTAEQIAAQHWLIFDKLALDVEAERRKQADKLAAEELDVEKRRNALLANEWERRAAELRTAAAETHLVLDADNEVAEKLRLIQVKLQRDLVELERERASQQQALA